MPFSRRTVAITVTYNPDLDILQKQLHSLNTQCETLFIDNHSKTGLDSIIKLCKTHNHTQCIQLDSNTGISNAQNIGIQHIRDNYPDVEFVLLLDHDSVPPEDMVKNLENFHDSLTKSGNQVAAVGPHLFDPRDGKYLGFHVLRSKIIYKKIVPALTAPPLECQGINSSGSLLSIRAINTIGLLDNTLFIDHGETEWCYRAMSKGYKVYGIPGVVMEHHMGDEVCEFWLFGKKRMPYRSPLRHYYIIRNSTLLQKRPYIPLHWKLMNIIKICFTYFYFGLLCKERREHRNYIFKGLRDGLRGRTGKLQQAVTDQK